MPFVIKDDVKAGYEGNLDAVPDSRVQYLLDTAVARLRKMIPSLESRIGTEGEPGYDADLAVLARDVVVQAVCRRLRQPSPDYTQETQTAGPFSHTVSTGGGNTRGNRGLFYDEELALLRPVVSSGVGRTAFLGLGYWGAKGAR